MSYKWPATAAKCSPTRRIKEARRLLTGSNLKIADIAERVGFESMTHFGRIFKDITSLSPLKYRQTYKAELD
ncbi:helix-turn-helix domain-containing protein [Paenibacillus favisporus]|uniref:helix-turn-helix domain-containing protein n=1 Tax=Paenibacillus favisporus TaxID=221028 RepID=UPI0013D16C2A|nr:helix-turn-helix domain-containing protein [Paenibacillus favisporus]